MSKIIATFIGVWLHPMQTMAGIKDKPEEGIKSSIIFVVAMGVLAGIISAVMSMIFPPPLVQSGQVPKLFSLLSIILYPLGSFIGSFIGAFILWGIIFGLLKSSAEEYKTAYRISALLAAFSPVVAILSPIPKVGVWLGFLINLYALIFVLIKGIIVVVETPKVRTWVILGTIFGFLMILNFVAQFAVEPQLAGNPDLPGLGADADIPQFDDEELRAELEALVQESENPEN